ERRVSVEAELVQSGYVLGHPVELAGVYRQKGRADNRRFATLLRGRVADQQVRLWQVSNGVHLYTDVTWGVASGDESTPGRRDVTQIDLREVRQALAPTRDSGWSNIDGRINGAIGQGEAIASDVNPALSAAFGGLPMLIESLGANFHFIAPRKMRLHNEPVFVTVGYWRPASIGALTAPDDTPTVGRLPHHVLLALGARDLFPYLIEYRGTDDPLAAAELSDNARLQQSTRPQLRIELRRPSLDTPIADAEFEYPEAGSVARRDVTDTRLANLKKRQRLKIAARSDTRTR
ncbi:MAG: hypothetical protein AAF596_09615, partial [Planctomycetota bacterium]